MDYTTPDGEHIDLAGNHYDYTHQAWLEDGKYARCGHPAEMVCTCYGRIHAGEPVASDCDIH